MPHHVTTFGSMDVHDKSNREDLAHYSNGAHITRGANQSDLTLYSKALHRLPVVQLYQFAGIKVNRASAAAPVSLAISVLFLWWGLSAVHHPRQQFQISQEQKGYGGPPVGSERTPEPKGKYSGLIRGI